MCPTGFRLGGVCSSSAEAPFLDLSLSVTDGVVSSGVCDGRDGFGFEIVGFPFLGGDVPRSPSCGVCVSRLVHFAGVCSNVDDFSNRSLFLAARLLKQGCGCRRIQRALSRFCRGHSGLVVECSVGLEALLQRGMSEPVFCGDLVYKFKRIVWGPGFGDQFKGIVKRYVGVGCGLDIMRRSACLVLGPVMVCGCGFLFSCTAVG